MKAFKGICKRPLRAKTNRARRPLRQSVTAGAGLLSCSRLPSLLGLSILLSLLAAGFSMQGVYAEGDECLVFDEWLYYDRGDHICICGYNGIEESITLPSEINGKRVTEISERAKEKEGFFDPFNTVTKEVTVAPGVWLIGKGTFSDSNIEKITLPESLEEIGEGAFYGCGGLKSVKIPEKVKIIGGEAFNGCGIEEIALYEGLESIGERAFSRCPLKKLQIPSTVVKIGGYAFSFTKIEEVILPKDLAAVEMGVFYGCSELKRACISEGTMALKDSVFFNCDSLEEVYFPSTLIKASVIFKNNRNLKGLYFAFEESRCKILLGGEPRETLFWYESEYSTTKEEYSYKYKDPKITFGAALPEHIPVSGYAHPPDPDSVTESAPAEKNSSRQGSEPIIFMAVTVLGAFLTAVFLYMGVKLKAGRTKERAGGGERKDGGFPIEVLGVWQCKKCGTVNSPIAAFCYRCGRKRREEEKQPRRK